MTLVSKDGEWGGEGNRSFSSGGEAKAISELPYDRGKESTWMRRGEELSSNSDLYT